MREEIKMGFCGSIIKSSLWILNFVLFLGGLAILAAGGYMHYKITYEYGEFFHEDASKAGIFGMAVGATVALVSFLGCCGLSKNSACMLKTYGVLVTVLLIAEIGTGIAATMYKKEAGDIATKGMMSALKKYNSDDLDMGSKLALNKVWDATQEGLQCCGVNEYSDWTQSPGWKNKQDVPDSCCKNKSEFCGKGAITNQDAIYTVGCAPRLVEEINANVAYVVWAGLGFGLFQVLLIVVSCVIGKKYGYEYEAQQVV